MQARDSLGGAAQQLHRLSSNSLECILCIRATEADGALGPPLFRPRRSRFVLDFLPLERGLTSRAFSLQQHQ